MAQQTFSDGEQRSSIRTKLNQNATEAQAHFDVVTISDETITDKAFAIRGTGGRSPLNIGTDGKVFLTPADEQVGGAALGATEQKLLGHGDTDDEIISDSVAVGRASRSYLSTTASGDGAVWEPLPPVKTHKITVTNNAVDSAGSSVSVSLELRRRHCTPDSATRYMGTWDATGTVPVQTFYEEFNCGLFWHISVTGNGYTAGNRLVFEAQILASDGYGTPAANAYREEVPDGTQRWRRGVWDATSGSYPTVDATVVNGDYWEVSVAGLYDNIYWPVNARLVRDSNHPKSWKIEYSYEVITVANSASVDLDCVAKGSEWEVRRADGTATTVYAPIEFLWKYSRIAYTKTVSGKRNIQIYDEATGKLDALTTANSDANNWSPKFSSDGSRLYFFSDRTAGRHWMLRLDAEPPYIPERMALIQSKQPRDVVIWGDSIGGHAYYGIKHAIDAMDLSNGNSYRTFTQSNAGSFTSRKIFEYMAYRRNELRDNIHIIYTDAGTSVANNPEILHGALMMRELLQNAGIQYVLVSASCGRLLVWDGGLSRFKGNAVNGIQTSSVTDLDSRLQEMFGCNYLSVMRGLQALSDGSLPDPQFPGDTQAESLAAYEDIMPFQWSALGSNDWRLWMPIIRQDLFVQARFQGYLAEGASPPGDGTQNFDYYLEQTNGANIHFWFDDGTNPAQWFVFDHDVVHPSYTGKYVPVPPSEQATWDTAAGVTVPADYVGEYTDTPPPYGPGYSHRRWADAFMRPLFEQKGWI